MSVSVPQRAGVASARASTGLDANDVAASAAPPVAPACSSWRRVISLAIPRRLPCDPLYIAFTSSKHVAAPLAPGARALSEPATRMAPDERATRDRDRRGHRRPRGAPVGGGAPPGRRTAAVRAGPRYADDHRRRHGLRRTPRVHHPRRLPDLPRRQERGPVGGRRRAGDV